MTIRSLSTAVVAGIALFGFGCSGGGSGTANLAGNCAVGAANASFCVTSCNLGCSNLGCSVTDIAPNQPIKLTFNRNVDPDTVSFSTISLKTASGRTPLGRFLVSGNVVEFRPEIRIVGGKTAFGFLANETYVLNLPDAGESGQVLRSVSGDGLSEPLVCNLRVSQRIVDLDQAPPRGKLLTPTATENVDKSTIIVVEFSELIDIAPFQGSTTATSPIRYLISKTVPKPGGGPNERICDQNFLEKINVEGLPVAENDPIRGVTTVTLRPTVPLPSQVCIEVVISPAVRDLAGTPAVEQTFRFTTEILLAGEGEVREEFLGDAQLDKTVSSGRWAGGNARPPQIGGLGTLGEFKAAAGAPDPSTPGRFVWNTDSMVIPREFSPTGDPITVTGGVFEFTRFELQPGQILAFEGSNPATILVRGEAIIDGKITANAPQAPYFLAVAVPGQPTPIGQMGANGNCGGAAGGQGGDSCLNTGVDPAYNGRDGQVVNLPSGNGYSAQAAQTGGKGSPLFPRNGITPPNGYCALNNVFCGIMGVGGGGGGFILPGGDGAPVIINGEHQNPCRIAANSAPSTKIGGETFDLGNLTNSNTGPTASLDFYSVGGSGGGGGGSHPLLSRGGSFGKWVAGSGGAGGGGVIRIQVGQDLTMTGGAIEVHGGAGYVIDTVQTAGENGDQLFNVPTPGGGGSGGSILLQVFGKSTLRGVIDCSGGKGGVLDTRPGNQTALLSRSTAGDGGAGYFRVESPTPLTVVDLGSTIPPAAASNTGTLTDSQFKGVTISKFYSTRLTFPPTFLRYKLDVEINGTRRLYSDDPEVGNPNAPQYDPDYAGLADETTPVYFQVQGAKVSATTGQADLLTVGAWHDYVNSATQPDLNKEENATGIRYRLIFDTAGGTLDIKVNSVVVNFVE